MAIELPVLYVVIPMHQAGARIWDSPRPQSLGAIKRRDVMVGTPLRAYDILNVDGVEYAWLVPGNPNYPEYARVAEADGSVQHLKVIRLTSSGTDALLPVLERLIAVVQNLTAAILSK